MKVRALFPLAAAAGFWLAGPSQAQQPGTLPSSVSSPSANPNQALADTIADNGPIAVRQAKKAIAWGAETDLETGMALAIEAYNNTVTTEDRLEGVRAFNEKRKPRFQGR